MLPNFLARSKHPDGSYPCILPIAHTAAPLLFTDDLHQNPLTATSVELTIKDLFPGTEIKFAFRNRDDHFAPHHLPLQMSIPIIFSRVVMPIASLVRSEPLEKFIIVLQQALLIVINIHTRRDMRGVPNTKPSCTRLFFTTASTCGVILR